MLRYELKKIFAKATSKLALLVLVIGTCVIINMAIGQVRYTDPTTGESASGIAAARQLRVDKQAWEGPVTAERLREVLATHRAIIQSSDYQSEDITRQNIAYSQTQGYEDLRDLINMAYSPLTEYDYSRIDTVTDDDVAHFYEARTASLQAFFEEEPQAYSQAEQDFLLAHYSAMSAPLYYTDADGWDALYYCSPSMIMFFIMVSIFFVAGVFPGERSTRADAIFFASKYGRDKAVRAKIGCVLLVTSVLYWLALAVYTLVPLAILGADGADCALQIIDWRSFYNLSIIQGYALILLGGYVGTMFMTLVAVLLSTRSRNAALAVTVPYVLIFATNFASNLLSGRSFLADLLGLMPDQLLQINQILHHFNLYTIAGTVHGSVPLLLILYSSASLVLLPLIYQLYRRRQVR
ncbi:MAG: ABC transporter permease [Peptococcaceae bacterium]|nr:ABC transporter permease [Peptococcaceae bacterium]